jgi:Fe2+ or Zn2+ uptake regulation protein
VAASYPDLVERVRARGWRMSAQRRVVAEVLRGDHVHMTAEEVFERAHARLDEISQATVYNTLRELVAMGELRVLLGDDGLKRYDPNVLEPHHHLLCSRCQRMLDVHPSGVEQVELAERERHGFVLEAVEVVFRGRCPECARAETSD